MRQRFIGVTFGQFGNVIERVGFDCLFEMFELDQPMFTGCIAAGLRYLLASLAPLSDSLGGIKSDLTLFGLGVLSASKANVSPSRMP